jgi:hypothetical protein
MKLKIVTMISLTLSLLFCTSVGAQNAEAAKAIKIQSPKAGSTVTFGEGDLVISGKSSDDATSDCKVGVRINDKSPYQPAVAAGPAGQNDYSSWKFTPNATYGSLKEGVNKITARLTCTTHLAGGDTSLSTKDNVIVAGVAAGPPAQ